jgi:hypothetical protein
MSSRKRKASSPVHQSSDEEEEEELDELQEEQDEDDGRMVDDEAKESSSCDEDSDGQLTDSDDDEEEEEEEAAKNKKKGFLTVANELSLLTSFRSAGAAQRSEAARKARAKEMRDMRTAERQAYRNKFTSSKIQPFQMETSDNTNKKLIQCASELLYTKFDKELRFTIGGVVLARIVEVALELFATYILPLAQEHSDIWNHVSPTTDAHERQEDRRRHRLSAADIEWASLHFFEVHFCAIVCSDTGEMFRQHYASWKEDAFEVHFQRKKLAAREAAKRVELRNRRIAELEKLETVEELDKRSRNELIQLIGEREAIRVEQLTDNIERAKKARKNQERDMKNLADDRIPKAQKDLDQLAGKGPHSVAHARTMLQERKQRVEECIQAYREAPDTVDGLAEAEEAYKKVFAVMRRAQFEKTPVADTLRAKVEKALHKLRSKESLVKKGCSRLRKVAERDEKLAREHLARLVKKQSKLQKRLKSMKNELDTADDRSDKRQQRVKTMQNELHSSIRTKKLAHAASA